MRQLVERGQRRIRTRATTLRERARRPPRPRRTPLWCAKFWPGGTVGPPAPGETRDPGLWARIPASGVRPVECWPPAYLPALDLSNDGSYASGFRFAGAGLASPEATARAAERAIRLHDAGKITDEGLERTLAVILDPAAGTGGVRAESFAGGTRGAFTPRPTKKTGPGDNRALTDAELAAAGACGSDDEFCAIFWPGGTVTRAGRTDAELLAKGYVPKANPPPEFPCYPPPGTPWWERLLAGIARAVQEVVEPVSEVATAAVNAALDFATAAPPLSNPLPPAPTAPTETAPTLYVYRLNAWPGGFVCDTDPPQRADLVPPLWSKGGPCPS